MYNLTHLRKEVPRQALKPTADPGGTAAWRQEGSGWAGPSPLLSMPPRAVSWARASTLCSQYSPSLSNSPFSYAALTEPYDHRLHGSQGRLWAYVKAEVLNVGSGNLPSVSLRQRNSRFHNYPFFQQRHTECSVLGTLLKA